MLLDAGLNDFEDFSPVPPDNYTFIIKKPVEITPDPANKTDIGGRVYVLIVRAEVLTGPCAGKEIRRRLSNASKASRFFLRNFVTKLGVSVTESGAFQTDALLGKQFTATVKERSYVDKETKETKKTSDFDDDSIVIVG